MSPIIESVVGIVCSKNGVLLGLRKHGGSVGNLWEFPGGKCEAGESHVEALVREYQEELAIEVEVGSFIAKNIFERGRYDLHLFAYEVIMQDEFDNVVCREHQRLAWFPADQLRDCQLVPSDSLFVSSVIDFYEKKYPTT